MNDEAKKVFDRVWNDFKTTSKNLTDEEMTTLFGNLIAASVSNFFNFLAPATMQKANNSIPRAAQMMAGAMQHVERHVSDSLDNIQLRFSLRFVPDYAVKIVDEKIVELNQDHNINVKGSTDVEH
jgi:hypothetical protein